MGSHRHLWASSRNGFRSSSCLAVASAPHNRPNASWAAISRRQHVEKEALQPVALAEHPVVVEIVEEVAPVEVHGCLQTGRVGPGRLRFEGLNVEPQGVSELNCTLAGVHRRKSSRHRQRWICHRAVESERRALRSGLSPQKSSAR